MSNDTKHTPAEEARAFDVAKRDAHAAAAVLLEKHTIPYPVTGTLVDRDALLADLAPVFERARLADPSVLGGLRLAHMDAEKLADALRERAERAEADYKEADRGCVELNTELANAQADFRKADAECLKLEEALQEAQADARLLADKRIEDVATIHELRHERDDARRERDDVSRLYDIAVAENAARYDDLARLRVREGQLRENIEGLAKSFGSEPGATTMNSVVAFNLRALLSSPPDAPDVLEAVRELARFAKWHGNGGLNAELATLRAARIVE